MTNWKSLVLALFLAVAIPLHAAAATSTKHHPKRHKKHTTTMTSTTAPKTTSQKVVSHVKSAGHKVSYNTWRLTHPHQAAAESAAERSADSAREAADRAREANRRATH
jgi:hypothetical protein